MVVHGPVGPTLNMTKPEPWQSLVSIEGCTESLQRSVTRLVRALHEAIPESIAGHLDAVHAPLSGTDHDRLDRAAAAIAARSDDEIEAMIRCDTILFHLLNQAEKQEIVRVNRYRSIQAGEDRGRPESIMATARALAEKGVEATEFGEMIRKLDIGPTLTAHPTEARRRSILSKQKAIGEVLSALENPTLTPDEQRAANDRLRRAVELLLRTDEVRSRDVDVSDEVEYGLNFLSSTIWEVLPLIGRDLREAATQHFVEVPGSLAPLRFRSWIGGDRDGNPKVTSAVTRDTAFRLRQAAVDLHTGELRELRRILSISDERVHIPDRLAESLQRDLGEVDPGEMARRHYGGESFRLKIACMEQRLRLLREWREADGPSPYDATRFRADIDLLADTLSELGLLAVVESGPVAVLRDRAAAFGLHLAALDIRQHSRRHEQAVGELLRRAGVTDEYSALPESDRIEILQAELRQPRPLLPPGEILSGPVTEVTATFDAIADLIRVEPDSIGSVIVSMTDAASDMLEVLVLAKEAGLWRLEEGRIWCPLDVVPLFETVDDLAAADRLMAELFENPIYRKHLENRGLFQEIMLGYSDSNKDGGFWMANWALHDGQSRLVRVCREHGIDFRLFHGRGGTVGRGGGRANRAISAMPAASAGGRIRFTEQGEVISFRYAQEEIAHRHLEQIVGAVLAAQVAGGQPEEIPPEWVRTMERIARTSMSLYRGLVEDPDFWTFYTAVTPVAQISRLPIASRPVSRGSVDQVDFGNLRAIPWVFAWTQTRYGVPGWYGSGAGLKAAVAEAGLESIRTMYREWSFFSAVIDNLQLEMVRARDSIAARYAGLGGPEAQRFHSGIVTDLQAARDLILSITDQDELLQNSPAVQTSVRYRDPHTDALNLMQIELLRRTRSAETDDEKGRLHEILFQSINGVAAAMQSTG